MRQMERTTITFVSATDLCDGLDTHAHWFERQEDISLRDDMYQLVTQPWFLDAMEESVDEDNEVEVIQMDTLRKRIATIGNAFIQLDS